jgi:hypothetical protein
MLPQVAVVDHCGKRYAESRSAGAFISSPQDILDLLVWGMENNIDLFLLNESDLARDFFELRTGLAGDILQKISNYGVRVAIVGSFATIRNRRFRELMFESNKGTLVRFASTKDEALSWLVRSCTDDAT